MLVLLFIISFILNKLAVNIITILNSLIDKSVKIYSPSVFFSSSKIIYLSHAIKLDGNITLFNTPRIKLDTTQNYFYTTRIKLDNSIKAFDTPRIK